VKITFGGGKLTEPDQDHAHCWLLVSACTEPWGSATRLVCNLMDICPPMRAARNFAYELMFRPFKNIVTNRLTVSLH
jgi:hypothetical protein